ncbi:MAG: hypothetical protein M0R33_15220 [Methylomonas sp.]|jgi:hypothetical protein|uniref:hypothetical protein n=1 Tax=Methylomonas sp. TaxID=418 RepID=UPI0025FCCC90|nr:hypothetical protein [Methylomonas sp.]MCK9607792.1 hypothetical protein [Methylomonas sp.]
MESIVFVLIRLFFAIIRILTTTSTAILQWKLRQISPRARRRLDPSGGASCQQIAAAFLVFDDSNIIECGEICKTLASARQFSPSAIETYLFKIFHTDPGDAPKLLWVQMRNGSVYRAKIAPTRNHTWKIKVIDKLSAASVLKMPTD